jgi:cytoskeletal protein RodZ
MNGFVKKSIGTLTLGEKMSRLREERRLSLKDVSKATRIQVKYLESLEGGLYNDLPADVYVKGFLRSYADFLGVNENIFIKLYNKEVEIKRNLDRSKNPEANWKKEKREIVNVSSFVFTPRVLAVGLALMVVFGIIFYLYKEIGSFSNEARLVVLSPVNNFTTEDNSVMVEGVTDRDAVIYINGKSVIVDDNGKFSENLNIQTGPNTINIKAVNKFSKESEETIIVQSNKKEEIANYENDNSLRDGVDNTKQKKVELELRVDPGPVWVSVEADDNLVFSGTVLSGSTQMFQAENKIVISSAKGNATLIKLNGGDFKPLNEEAKPVKGLTFTTESK